MKERFEVTGVSRHSAPLRVHIVYLLRSHSPLHQRCVLIRTRELGLLEVLENYPLNLFEPRKIFGNVGINVLHILPLPLYQDLLHVLIHLLEGNMIALLLRQGRSNLTIGLALGQLRHGIPYVLLAV